MMTGPSPRHNTRFGKSHSFLLPGMLVVIVILSFNYWRTSRLNKGLLENVAVSEARSQRLDKDLRAAHEAKEECTKSNVELKKNHDKLRDEFSQLTASSDADKTSHTAALENMQQQIDTLRGQHDTLVKTHDTLARSNEELQKTHDNLKSTHNNLQSEKDRLDTKTLDMESLESTIATLNATSVKLTTEKVVILDYISSELGKEGVEYLLGQKVILPQGFAIPSVDQQPLCTKRAEEKFRAKAANEKKMQNQDPPNKDIQSIHADMKELPQEGTETEQESLLETDERKYTGKNQPGEPAPVQGDIGDKDAHSKTNPAPTGHVTQEVPSGGSLQRVPDDGVIGSRAVKNSARQADSGAAVRLQDDTDDSDLKRVTKSIADPDAHDDDEDEDSRDIGAILNNDDTTPLEVGGVGSTTKPMP